MASNQVGGEAAAWEAAAKACDDGRGIPLAEIDPDDSDLMADVAEELGVSDRWAKLRLQHYIRNIRRQQHQQEQKGSHTNSRSRTKTIRFETIAKRQKVELQAFDNVHVNRIIADDTWEDQKHGSTFRGRNQFVDNVEKYLSGHLQS